MNSDKLLNIYEQLEDMEQTKEVALLKSQIKTTLYQDMRTHFIEQMNIGRVIGYDELQAEFGQAIGLIEIQKKFNG